MSADAFRQALARVRAGIPETFEGARRQDAEMVLAEIGDVFGQLLAATPAPARPIYVVVMSTGGQVTEAHPKGGPIVMETEVADGASLESARKRAAAFERQYGASRVGRVVFEDEPGFMPEAPTFPGGAS
jgi:hypothetical protein